jgi:signal transduction histidine kinase
MNVFEIEIKRRIKEFLIITKVASNFICLIAILGNMNVSFTDVFEGTPFFSTILFLLGATLIQVYLDAKNIAIPQGSLSIKGILEILLFLAFYTTLVYLTGWKISEFKILYVFAILITSIQYNLWISLGVCTAASLLIVSTNFITLNPSKSSIYFQHDIALIGLFYLLCLLIGQYKRIYDENNQRYQKISQLLPSSVIIYNSEEILYSNTSGTNLLNLVNKNQLLEDIEKVKTQIETLCNVDERGYYTREVEIINQDLTSVYSITSSIYPHNHDFAVISVIKDISERKRAEALNESFKVKERQLKDALEYDRIKTEFFSNMSHEFKTPINIVLSTLQLFEFYGIKEQAVKNEDWVKRNLKVIKQNCFRLLRLVSNILDLTKLDSNFSQIKLKNHNIINIVEDITMSVVTFVESKDISICFDTDVEEKIIACDPDKIEKIMLNLLSNAVKYTDAKGSIFVNIFDKGDKIYISVKDNGVGIPEDKLGIIFDRFRQVDELMVRRAEGSGIGLALVKSLVEQHGGSISVTSEFGKGTEFIIELPCIQVDADADSTHGNVSINQYISSELIEMEFSDIYK